MKNKFETLNDDTLHRTATQLARLQLEKRAIVVHGAGSFGHHTASDYEVAKGGRVSDSLTKGFALTRQSVTKLQQAVISSLITEGVLACGVSLCGVWVTNNREVLDGDTHGIRQILQFGMTPVTHGDAVFDDRLGCTILSGDTIMKHLAKEMAPEYAVFLTNVEGVYDRPPEEAGAQLLRRILVQADGSWRAEGGSSFLKFTAADHDTTGGIEAKVREAAAIAVLGKAVLIAKVGTEDAYAALAHGPAVLQQPELQWRGTIVQLEQSSTP